MRSGGNNFDYFCESVISVLTKKIEIGGGLCPLGSLGYATGIRRGYFFLDLATLVEDDFLTLEDVGLSSPGFWSALPSVAGAGVVVAPAPRFDDLVVVCRSSFSLARFRSSIVTV